MSQKYSLYITLVIVVLLIVAFALWQQGILRPGGLSPTPAQSEPVPESLGGDIHDSANPVKDRLPETNPFQETETNPFEGYKNPFE